MHFKQKILLSISLSILAATFTTAATANPKIEAAKRCLGDNTTGKDRKELAKWIFLVLGNHPEISTIVPTPPELLEKSSQTIGLLFNSLTIEKCNGELRDLITESGPSAIELPFKFLGELATKELMTDPNVAKSMQGFVKYLDRENLDKALKAK